MCRFTETLKAINEGVWNWNMVTDTVWVSAIFAEILTGSDESTVVDRRLVEARVHPEDANQVDDCLQKHLDGIVPYYSTTYRLLTHQGIYVPIADRARVVTYGNDGRPILMAGIIALQDEHKLLSQIYANLTASNYALQMVA